jgi:hypothetical protein
MSKFDSWFSAQIREVFFKETQRGTTPLARNRASWLAGREQDRERRLRAQVRKQYNAEPEELLRERVTK